MEHISVREVLIATGGTLLCGNESLELKNISLNSSLMSGNDLFVPLIGAKVDAHKFITQAFENGAVATLTSNLSYSEGSGTFIYVPDTKIALQDIGRYCRARVNIPMIGVTGTVGKTTTREMMALALSAEKRVFRTAGNSNSQVGLPITLANIVEEDEIAVIELGMSEPGELTIISKIAKLHMAVITNIGYTHVEQVGSREGVLFEKMSIEDGMDSSGILLLNKDDDLLCNTTSKIGCKTFYYSMETPCDYYAKNIRLQDGYPSFTAVCRDEETEVTLGVIGKHNVSNAMAALATAHLNGVDIKKAANKLKSFEGYQRRQQTYERNGITIVDDTYNASPISMKAAVDIIEHMQGTRKILVLADMKELGDKEWQLHGEIGTYMKGLKLDYLFTLGELAKAIPEQFASESCICNHYDFGQQDTLKIELEHLLKAGDCILLKGSNSMMLSGVVAHLLEKLK